MTLIYLACGLLLLVVSNSAYQALRIARLRRSGVYPLAGRANDGDVLRLLRSGRRHLAMRCYREIHGGTLTDSKAAIDNISI